MAGWAVFLGEAVGESLSLPLLAAGGCSRHCLACVCITPVSPLSS